MTGDKDYLLEALNQKFGYGSFLSSQHEIISNVLSGRDSLVVMPTGSGKSICYQLPSLFIDRLTLVVSPLIALMKDQVDALRLRGFRAAFVNSTMTSAEQHKVQSDAQQGVLDILYVAPERLVSPQFRDFVLDLKPGLVAIDEAHCISEWGHDFRPDYRKLQFLRPSLPDTTLIALTATATERVREDILRQLEIPEATRFVTSFNRPNLVYDVRPKRNSFATILSLLEGIDSGSAIIYCSFRQQTEDLARSLSDSGFLALAYHAGLGAKDRQQTQEQFMDGRVSVIVATIAFGMGIDKPNVRLVVHYDLPKSIEGYYQETGRAGRDGQPSNCVLFFSYRDKSQQDFFVRKIEDPVERANAEKRLTLMVKYCQIRSCRRQFLLNYFGEEWSHDNCGSCDVCRRAAGQLDSGKEFDGTELAQKIMSAIIKTGERFGAGHIVSVLRGGRGGRIIDLGHDQLSVYGIAGGVSTNDLKDAIDQLVDIGLVDRAIDGLPVLSIAADGKKFIKDHGSVTLIKRESSEVTSTEPGLVPDHDKVLFEKLRQLRKEIAGELNLPAYIVFHDSVLHQMASKMPVNQSELIRVRGVGSEKLQRFGDQFIAVIVAHKNKGGESSDPAEYPTGPPLLGRETTSTDYSSSAVNIDSENSTTTNPSNESIIENFRHLETYLSNQEEGIVNDKDRRLLREAGDHLALARDKFRRIFGD